MFLFSIFHFFSPSCRKFHAVLVFHFVPEKPDMCSHSRKKGECKKTKNHFKVNIYVIFAEEISDRRVKWIASFFFFSFFHWNYFLLWKVSALLRHENFVPLKSITIKFIISMMKRSIKISDDKWRLHIKMVSLKLFLLAIKYPFYDIISFSFHPVCPNYFVFNICKCLSDD